MAVPRVFDRNMKRLAYLDNAISVGYSLEMNTVWTATFTLPADDKKNQYCNPQNYVEIFDGDKRIDLFRIIGEDLERGDGATRYYECEHVIATLLNDVLFQYHQCGGYGVKTADVLAYLLAQQTIKNWSLGICDFSRYFEYGWENTTILAALFAVPECFDSDYVWTWDTTGYPWTLSLRTLSNTLKSEIRYGKNLTSIKKTVDATGIANRIYALGYGEGVNQLTIKNVNNGLPYVEDKLSAGEYGPCSAILVDSRYTVEENLKAYAEQVLRESATPYISYEAGAVDLHRLTGDPFSRYWPGEIVRVVDDEDGVNFRARIVKVEKSDAQGDPGNITVTIANKTRDVAESISDLQSRALIGETYAQGATNQQIYNFSDNADQRHPASLRLYISSDVVRINKMLLNLQFEPFRAYEQAVESGGGMTTESGGGTTAEATEISMSVSENDPTQDFKGGANHNHGISRGTRLALTTDGKSVSGYIPWAPSGKHSHGTHTHEIPNHTHEIASHTHGIKFGIYEGPRASKATIKVDGKRVPVYSGYEDIDIIEYLSTDSNGKIARNTWHTIEIYPNSMSRIVAAVFSQTFCNSRGGGDY